MCKKMNEKNYFFVHDKENLIIFAAEKEVIITIKILKT